MKISQLIKELTGFREAFGDCEVEFLEYDADDMCDPVEVDFIKLHEGYYQNGPHTLWSVRSG
jgi:hypothetical protein